MSPKVECTACGWQGDASETDAMFCPEPECGGECMYIEQIYSDEEQQEETES